MENLTTSDYMRAFEGMRSKSPGRFEYDLADLICKKADSDNARRLVSTFPEYMEDWLKRADKLPNGGRG